LAMTGQLSALSPVPSLSVSVVSVASSGKVSV